MIFLGWFISPGPLVLLITPGNTSNEILIRQRLFRGSLIESNPQLVPINVHMFSQNNQVPKPITLTQNNQTIQTGQHDAYLVDPDEHTLTIKIYSAKNYIYFAQGNKSFRDCTLALINSLKMWATDFCTALVNDVFPIEDSTSFNASEWSQVFTYMKPLARGQGCRCCLKVETEETCTGTWAEKCQILKIRRLLAESGLAG